MVRPPMTRSWQRPLTAGLLLTVVCVAFEGLAVTTVMPTAVRELGGLMSYGWAFSAFMLTNVVGIAVAGARMDRHGPRGPLAAGLALFALGLLGGGAAPSMAALIAARAVQGFGAGELSAVIYACVARCYPADQQPRMLALLSTAWVVPGLVGPGVSGYVADHMSWRLVFIGLVPIVFVAAALTVPALSRLPPPPDGGASKRMSSPIGPAVLLAAGSVVVLLGLAARALTAVLGLATLGAVMALPGIRRVMPEGTLRARAGIPATILSMATVSVAFFGAEILLPLMLTLVRGQSATVAGLSLSGATFAWTAGAWVQAREAKRRSRGLLVGIGAALIACGIAIVSFLLVAETPVAVAALGWAVAGLGMGVAHATISLAVIEQAPAAEEGAASAAMQLANVLGVALGAGLGGAAVALADTRGAPPIAGFALGFATMLAAALATLGLARRLPGAPRAAV